VSDVNKKCVWRQYNYATTKGWYYRDCGEGKVAHWGRKVEKMQYCPFCGRLLEVER